MDENALLDSIYEAAAVPDRWPSVLHDVAQSHGAKGATIFAAQAGRTEWIASPVIVPLFEQYVSQGWMNENVRGAEMIRQAHPWFVTDSDFLSIEQMQSTSVYRDFLIPLGYDAAAGTVVQGSHHDIIVITLEGFPSHVHAKAACSRLNKLRPHLGRAVSLMARIRLSRSQAMVDGIGTLGTAAAVIDSSGKLRSSNSSFNAKLGNLILERKDRLCLLDRHADQVLLEVLTALQRSTVGARSTVIRRIDGAPVVAHLIPLKLIAQEVFDADGLLLLIADGANAAFPDANLLRLLFDLTPAEARITRSLGEGLQLSEAASLHRMTYATAKVHLRSIFSKTGVRRQAELVSLLSDWIAPPLPHTR